LDALQSLDLNIDDVRGQGYDNGSNMKGNIKVCRHVCLKLIQEHCICHVHVTV